MRAVVAFASAADDEIVLLGDVNARLGSVCSPVLGIHVTEVENKNGALFRHTLEGCTLIASSTFFPTGAGTSSHGTERRIDYVCFSHKLHEAVSVTCTLKDQVLLARNGADHECAVARFQIEKDVTSCDACAGPSRRDKAKRHLSH